MKNHFRSLATLACLTLLVPTFAWGSQTRWWKHSTREDFRKGDLKGVSLTSDGKLKPAPALKEIFDSGEAFVYSALIDRVGNTYLGTGNNGKIYRLTAAGTSSEFAKIGDSGIFAMASDSNGRLFAASGPNGEVYSLDSTGKTTVFFQPRQKYIWSLAVDSQNNLYVGTGPKGQIFRVDPQGQARLFYDSEETHIVELEWDLDGNLLVGTSPGGLVMRLTPQGQSKVLFDSPRQEVKAITTDRYGTIFAAALSTPTTKESGQGSKPSKPPQKVESKVEAAGVRPGEGLEVYRIDREGLVEKLYSSDSEAAFDLKVRPDGSLLVATGPKGRVLSISERRFVTDLVQSPEEQVTHLLGDDRNLTLVTSNLGKVFSLRSGGAEPRVYLSEILDAKTPARWGTMRWSSQPASGSTARFYTRSGNTKVANQTWGDWSEAYSDGGGSPITSPPGRYLQYKLEFASASNEAIEQVAISYLQNNMAPSLVSLTVHPAGKAFVPLPSSSGGSPPPGGPNGSHAQSLPPELRRLNGAAPIPNPRKIFIPGARSFTWDAQDPNDDALTYSLYRRRVGEAAWEPVKQDITDRYHTLDGASLADGIYFLKVVVSDRLTNSPSSALTGEMVSKAFIVSNSGPAIQLAAPRINGRDASLQFTASSGVSTLFQAEFQLDGGAWEIIQAQDGITDGNQETFRFDLKGLAPGDRVVSVRVINAVGNISTQRSVLKIR